MVGVHRIVVILLGSDVGQSVVRLSCGGSKPLLGPFHVPLGCGWAWTEAFGDQVLIHVRAPFEKTLLQCFHEGGDFWIAQ